jgi:MinD-like ATPase involved in chromosome partitioning or flagellar assembly
MGKVIGLISLKGGVGKTTLSCALAADLVYNHGKKVLLVDANYSAPNLGLHMNIISPKMTIHDVLAGGQKITSAIHDKYGVHVIPGNFLFKRDYNVMKLKNKLSSVKKRYDFIILDASPALNDEVLSTMSASDGLFIVSTADYPTLSCSMKAAKLARQRNSPIAGLILNRVRGKYEIGVAEVQESTGIPVVAKVRDDDIVQMALHERVPATLFAKDARFSREIGRLSLALLGKEKKAPIFSRLFSKNLPLEHVNREVLRRGFYKSMFR